MQKDYFKVSFIASICLIVLFTSFSKNDSKKIINPEREITDPPPVRTYPSSEATVNQWIYDMDNVMIRAHAWDIWESITTTTASGKPVWETWYSGHELFDLNKTKVDFRKFELPQQFIHHTNRNDIPSDRTEVPASFNRFSKNLADLISSKGFFRKAILDSINSNFDRNKTETISRTISTSIDSVDALSFALKPVFQFISKDSATAIPYWAGVSPATTTSLTNPEPHTWRQCVIVDPTGKLKPGTTHRMSFNDEPPQDWPVVSLDRFYHFQLTKEEAESFDISFGATSGDDVGFNNMTDTAAIFKIVKQGNYALLMAMHVTGKEVVNWTWQTFWWSPNNDDVLFGIDRPSTIQSPWSNYNMRTAYYMVSPPNKKHGGEPLISFNPYLETNLFGKVPGPTPQDSISWYGVFSNCMSCHRMAAYPNNFYISDGYIDPADEKIFSKITKTDFLWSIPTRAK